MFFTSCKPTSAIITSKELAVKKGVYTEPSAVKTTSVKKKKIQKEALNRQVARLSNAKKHAALNNQNSQDIIIEKEDTNYLISQIINSAADNLGVNYRSGGTTKAGFDCSGLLFSTFLKFNITLPRSSHEMGEIGKQVTVADAKKGDLIFFINKGQKRINHVGMIVALDGDDVKFIHSSTQSGVIISSLKESYYERTFKQINRILD